MFTYKMYILEALAFLQSCAIYQYFNLEFFHSFKEDFLGPSEDETPDFHA